MNPNRLFFVGLIPLTICLPVIAMPPASVTEGLDAIRAVSREGQGNEAASRGWKAVTSAGVAGLLPTLTAFSNASPAAVNWLRSAVDAIVEAEEKAGRPLPVRDLQQFLSDTKQSPAARRIAFELLNRQVPEETAKIIVTMIDDPSVEIRRDAIEARMKAAESLTGDVKRSEYTALFAASRDKDQAEELLKRLKAAGGSDDLTRHFGYITEWQVAGPFDSPGGSGFAKVYPPEEGIDYKARYSGKDGAELAWKPVQSAATYGTIDLNLDLGTFKDACAYAAADIVAEKDTPAEIRINTPNAVQIFLNGKKVYEHEEYHHGDRFDQYSVAVKLTAGKNRLLVKVCQNDQKEPWAQKWQFALRICDATGGALPLQQIVIRDGKETTITPGALKPVPTKEENK
jgi:hypothetical protein